MEAEQREQYVIQGRKNGVARHPRTGKKVRIGEGEQIPSWVSQRQLDEWIVGGFAVRKDDPAFVGIVKFAELNGDVTSEPGEEAQRAAEQREDEREDARRRAAAAKESEEQELDKHPEDSDKATRRQRDGAGSNVSKRAGGEGPEPSVAAKAEERMRAAIESSRTSPGDRTHKQIKEPEPSQKEVWNHAPEDLGGKQLPELQVLVAERIEKYDLDSIQMPDSVEGCIELLTSEYDPAYRNQG